MVKSIVSWGEGTGIKNEAKQIYVIKVLILHIYVIKVKQRKRKAKRKR